MFAVWFDGGNFFFFFFFGAPLDSSGTWNSVSDIWSLQKWLLSGIASTQIHDK